jgi:hypothetical protein
MMVMGNHEDDDDNNIYNNTNYNYNTCSVNFRHKNFFSD